MEPSLLTLKGNWKRKRSWSSSLGTVRCVSPVQPCTGLVWWMRAGPVSQDWNTWTHECVTSATVALGELSRAECRVLYKDRALRPCGLLKRVTHSALSSV